ncbi:MAG: glycosyltransferase family 87 protein [Bacteroidota bacterium]
MFICIFVGFKYAGTRLTDFAGYYTAGRMLLEGHRPQDLYDDAKFQQAMSSYGIKEPTIIMYVNPPTVGLVTIPVAFLSPFPAKLVWDVVSVVCVVAAWRILGRALHVPAGSRYMILLLLLLAGTLPFLRNLQLGQMYAVVLLLFSVLLHSYLSRWVPGTALSLAAIILLKYYGWLFLVLFIMQKRWREFWWSLFATGTGLALCIWHFGIDAYAMQMNQILSMPGQADTASFALRSVVAPLSKLFVFHEAWNPTAVAHQPLIPSVAPWILLASAVWFSARKQAGNDSVLVSIFLLLSVLFTPLAADHHYILLTIPVFVLVASTGWASLSLLKLTSLGVCIYLLLGWLPQIPPQLLDGWWSLLAYSRLYAAMCVWFLLLQLPSRSRDTTVPETRLPWNSPAISVYL